MSSIGITCEYPPPAAPPLTPKTGPRLGSRMHRMALMFARRSACARPTATVLLPSPAGVGLIAVTSTSRPRTGRDARSIGSFALNLPYNSRSSASSPRSRATSTMGRGFTLCAISMSVGIWFIFLDPWLGFLLDSCPTVFQRHRSVEHRSARLTVLVHAEVPDALELEARPRRGFRGGRSEEHTSELQ